MVAPRLQVAVAELQSLILQAYPTATFEIVQGTDPEGTYVIATVDVEDTEVVVDVYIERLLELQIDAGLPVYVVPVRPLARVLSPQAAMRERMPTAAEPSPSL
jgi:H2-forming N5,N10-methylenetetrahydromethanopterin dehydrogenase-like enzyme